MSRLSRALAAAAMTVAAAGGALVLTASAAPAYASAPAAAHAGHPHGGHAIDMTISAHRADAAAGGASPRTQSPCVTAPGPAEPGATPNDTGCGPLVISCHLSVSDPSADPTAGTVTADAIVQCTNDVTKLDLSAILSRSGSPVASNGDLEMGQAVASTGVLTDCSATAFSASAQVTTTFPPGYVLTGGSNPAHATSALVQIPDWACLFTMPGGGGGGGGCAIPAPSPASHPAGRQPDIITCP